MSPANIHSYTHIHSLRTLFFYSYQTWIQQVKEDHGCTIDSLWSSAHDRSLWRSLRPSLVRRSSEWVSNYRNL